MFPVLETVVLPLDDQGIAGWDLLRVLPLHQPDPYCPVKESNLLHDLLMICEVMLLPSKIVKSTRYESVERRRFEVAVLPLDDYSKE